MSSTPAAHESSARTEQTHWISAELRPHEATLRSYLRSSFPSIDVDDVVQDSYLKILRARTARRIASAKAYFFSTARNTALTFFQRRQIYSETPVSQLPESCIVDGQPDASDVADGRQRIELVGKAMERLPPRCRDVLRLAVLRGLSNAEIALELGIAENTVRVQIARGVKKCADYLREHGERR